MNMSGVRDDEGFPSRLKEVQEVELEVRGFDGGCREGNLVGINEDGKREVFVKGMREDLVLLCAQQYVAGGAAILFENDGYVVKMEGPEREELEKFVRRQGVEKVLVVENGTYRVSEGGKGEEMAMVANTYFNTKVNVSNGEERVLAYLLCGLTWDMLWSAIDKGSITGLHPGITKSMLSQFGRKWGKSPDFLQMAHPNITGNEKGYMSVREETETIGSVQIDYMSFDFNEKEEVPMQSESISGWKKRKLLTFGGAMAACRGR